MYRISGFIDYLERNYEHSTFTELLASGDYWYFHLQGGERIGGRIVAERVYDFDMLPTDTNGSAPTAPRAVSKLEVKLMHPAELRTQVEKLLKTDQRVAQRGFEPIARPKERHHIKNRTLYPLMKEKVVVFVTLLEGEVVRGLIGDFSRYEIIVKLKGGMPVTVLRHAIYDIRDKQGRCYLKSVQQQAKDWLKSNLVERLEGGSWR
jgi:sRNA-binding regulator protein Hfq